MHGGRSLDSLSTCLIGSVQFMPEIRMRRKHQITLPAVVVRAAKLQPDDRLNVDYLNGVIVITPKVDAHRARNDLMSFAGIGKSLWGDTPDQVNTTLADLRDAGER